MTSERSERFDAMTPGAGPARAPAAGISKPIELGRQLAMREAPRSIHLVSVAMFALAGTTAAAAQQSDRPITAAIIFLFGVTLVGALEGLWGGLLAALAASAIYNFFLSDPVFRFSLSSAEEYVPLIAFNVSAAASGLLAGRLRDRVRAAEFASRRMRALFDVSQGLQAALRVSDIPAAIQDFTFGEAVPGPEIYLGRGDALEALQPSRQGLELARRLWSDGGDKLAGDGRSALLLSTPAARSGVLVLAWHRRREPLFQEHETEAFVNLLSITLERCLLLEQLAEAELVKRSEEFKTALLSSVSHDMRTPLSAISASASSLARFGPSLSEDIRADFLNMIQEQCERLNRYTTNLLNLGRIQAGMDASRFAGCDALEVLGSAIGHARGAATGHEIVKRYGLASANVRADPVMLEQVFFNVLENALRYSPDGSRVLVSADREDDRLVIEIADEGEGIAEADIERVFDRFYRARSSGGHDGNGLGLSIARGFTEAFGGTIEALRRGDGSAGTIVRISLVPEAEVNRK